jgi:hypothetical protein
MRINFFNAYLTNPYYVSYKGTDNPTASNNERDKQMPSNGTMIQPRMDISSPGLQAASCTSPSLSREEYTYLEPLSHEKHQTFPAILKTKVLVRPFCPTYHICCLIANAN